MSCLFHALATFVSDSSPEIRQRVCDYIGANKPLMDGIATDKLFDAAYTANMRNCGTWGGGGEIQAFCMIYNISVVVTSTRSGDRANRPMVFVPMRRKLNTARAYLYWDGGHYTPAPVRLVGI